MGKRTITCGLLLGTALCGWGGQARSVPTPGVLAPADLTEAVPATVFFAGKVASVQVRNSGAVRSSEGKLTEFALVDSSGYSSAIRERYQLYILTEVPIQLGDRTLPAGAYGAGLVDQDLVVMDLGAHDISRAQAREDVDMKRPRPLQLLSSNGELRLYLGRNYVTFRQAAGSQASR